MASGRGPPHSQASHHDPNTRTLPSFQAAFSRDREGDQTAKYSLPPLNTHFPSSSSRPGPTDLREHTSQFRDGFSSLGKRPRVTEDEFSGSADAGNFRGLGSGHHHMAVDTLAPSSMLGRPSDRPPEHRRELEWQCCGPTCQGVKCSAVRKLLEELVEQVIDIDISEPTKSRDDLRTQVSLIHKVAVTGVLTWIVDRLKANSSALKSVFTSRFNADPSSRKASLTDQRPAARVEASVGNVHRRGSQLHELSQDQRPHQSPIAQSPVQPRFIPTPTSMNIPGPSAASESPAMTDYWSASNQHMQELQRQVSVKTVALISLDREYQSLLQRLDRQRLKSQTLERKFEATDAEINTLTDDKERLEKQVETLEKQLEDANTARDEARVVSTQQATQYMQMLKMESKLSEKVEAERTAWKEERMILKKRIETLEAKVEASKLSNNSASDEPDVRSRRGENSTHVAALDMPLDTQAIPKSAIEDPLATKPTTAGTGPIPLSEQMKAQMMKHMTSIHHARAGQFNEEKYKLEAQVRVLKAALRAIKEEAQSSREAMLQFSMASKEKIDDIFDTAMSEASMSDQMPLISGGFPVTLQH